MLNPAGISALIAIFSSGSCPSVDAVQARLAPLLPRHASNDTVHLEQSAAGLEVVMRSAFHRTELRRTLPPRYTCEELAALVATLIAAWQLEEGEHPSAPEPPVPKPTPLPSLRTTPEPRRAPRYEIGGALAGGVAGGAVAAVGQLDLILMPRSWNLGLRLGLLAYSPRSLPLGPGGVSWLRAGLRASGGYRFRPAADRSWSLDWFGDAMAALVSIRGSGFALEHAGVGADFALGTSARIGRQLGSAPVRLFLEVALLGWLRPQRVIAQTEQPLSITLPQLEVLLGLGLAGAGSRAPR